MVILRKSEGKIWLKINHVLLMVVRNFIVQE